MAASAPCETVNSRPSFPVNATCPFLHRQDAGQKQQIAGTHGWNVGGHRFRRLRQFQSQYFSFSSYVIRKSPLGSLLQLSGIKRHRPGLSASKKLSPTARDSPLQRLYHRLAQICGTRSNAEIDSLRQFRPGDEQWHVLAGGNRMRLLRIASMVARDDTQVARAQLIQQFREPPIEVLEGRCRTFRVRADDIQSDEDQTTRNFIE